MGNINKHLAGTYVINYHIVWCPKRRKAALNGNIASDCENIIRKIAEEINVKVENISVMPDQVRIFLSANPKISPHCIVKRLKGAASSFLRKKYPQLLTLSSLWSSSYYVGTVGCVSDSVINLYIENQKGK